jgi:hypothetical protein
MPVMPPFNYYALRHDGHEVITIFTMIFAPDQLQADMCPSMGQLFFEGAPTTCDLRVHLPVHQLGRGFAIELVRLYLQNK